MTHTRKIKELFNQVQEMERTVHNALKYYRQLEDSLSTLHYELDGILTVEELEHEDKKDLRSGRGLPGNDTGERNEGSDHESDACAVGGSKGACGVASDGGSINLSDYPLSSSVPVDARWDKDTRSQQLSPHGICFGPKLPSFRDEENGQINV